MPSSSMAASGTFVCVLLAKLALDTTACTNVTIGSTRFISIAGTIGAASEIVFGLSSTSVLSQYWFTGVDMCPADCSSGCFRDLSISLGPSNAGPWATIYSSGGYIQNESCFRPYNMRLSVPISGPSNWTSIRMTSNGTMRFANVSVVQQSPLWYYSATSSSATPVVYHGVLGNVYYCSLVPPPTNNETLPFTAPVTAAPATLSPTRVPTTPAPTYNPAVGCQEINGCGTFFFSCQTRTPRMGDAPSCPRTCGAPGCTPTSAPPPTALPSPPPSTRPPSSATISSAPSSPPPPSSLGTLAPGFFGSFVPTAVPFSAPPPPPSSTSSSPSRPSNDDDYVIRADDGGTAPPTLAPTGGELSAGSGGSSDGGGGNVPIIILIVVLIALAGAIAVVVITRRRRREAAKEASPIHPRGSVITNPAFASDASRNSASDSKNNNGKRSGGGALSPQRAARMAQTLAGTGSSSKGRVTVDEDRYVAGPALVQGPRGNDYIYAEPSGPSEAARAPNNAGRGSGKNVGGANSGRGGRGRGGRGRGGGPTSKTNASVDDYAYQMPIPTQDNEYEVPVAVSNEYEAPALSSAFARAAKDSDVYYGLPDVSKAKPGPKAKPG